MKKTLLGLMVLISLLFSVNAHAQYTMAPKFAYDKSKAYLRGHANKWDPAKYKAFYFMAPYSGGYGGAEHTPILCTLVYDLENKKMFFYEQGLKYNDNGDIVFFTKEIPMAYTTPSFIQTQGDEYYIIQDMGDGRGPVARRNWGFDKDPVDRGPASSLANLLSSGKTLYCDPVTDLSTFEDAYSIFY